MIERGSHGVCQWKGNGRAGKWDGKLLAGGDAGTPCKSALPAHPVGGKLQTTPAEPPSEARTGRLHDMGRQREYPTRTADLTRRAIYVARLVSQPNKMSSGAGGDGAAPDLPHDLKLLLGRAIRISTDPAALYMY